MNADCMACTAFVNCGYCVDPYTKAQKCVNLIGDQFKNGECAEPNLGMRALNKGECPGILQDCAGCWPGDGFCDDTAEACSGYEVPWSGVTCCKECNNTINSTSGKYYSAFYGYDADNNWIGNDYEKDGKIGNEDAEYFVTGTHYLARADCGDTSGLPPCDALPPALYVYSRDAAEAKDGIALPGARITLQLVTDSVACKGKKVSFWWKQEDNKWHYQGSCEVGKIGESLDRNSCFFNQNENGEDFHAPTKGTLWTFGAIMKDTESPLWKSGYSMGDGEFQNFTHAINEVEAACSTDADCPRDPSNSCKAQKCVNEKCQSGSYIINENTCTAAAGKCEVGTTDWCRSCVKYSKDPAKAFCKYCTPGKAIPTQQNAVYEDLLYAWCRSCKDSDLQTFCSVCEPVLDTSKTNGRYGWVATNSYVGDNAGKGSLMRSCKGNPKCENAPKCVQMGSDKSDNLCKVYDYPYDALYRYCEECGSIAPKGSNSVYCSKCAYKFSSRQTYWDAGCTLTRAGFNDLAVSTKVYADFCGLEKSHPTILKSPYPVYTEGNYGYEFIHPETIEPYGITKQNYKYSALTVTDQTKIRTQESFGDSAFNFGTYAAYYGDKCGYYGWAFDEGSTSLLGAVDKFPYCKSTTFSGPGGSPRVQEGWTVGNKNHHCYNGMQDCDETGLDCGGSCCLELTNGKKLGRCEPCPTGDCKANYAEGTSKAPFSYKCALPDCCYPNTVIPPAGFEGKGSASCPNATVLFQEKEQSCCFTYPWPYTCTPGTGSIYCNQLYTVDQTLAEDVKSSIKGITYPSFSSPVTSSGAYTGHDYALTGTALVPGTPLGDVTTNCYMPACITPPPAKTMENCFSTYKGGVCGWEQDQQQPSCMTLWYDNYADNPCKCKATTGDAYFDPNSNDPCPAGDCNYDMWFCDKCKNYIVNYYAAKGQTLTDADFPCCPKKVPHDPLAGECKVNSVTQTLLDPATTTEKYQVEIQLTGANYPLYDPDSNPPATNPSTSCVDPDSGIPNFNAQGSPVSPHALVVCGVGDITEPVFINVTDKDGQTFECDTSLAKCSKVLAEQCNTLGDPTLHCEASTKCVMDCTFTGEYKIATTLETFKFNAKVVPHYNQSTLADAGARTLGCTSGEYTDGGTENFGIDFPQENTCYGNSSKGATTFYPGSGGLYASGIAQILPGYQMDRIEIDDTYLATFQASPLHPFYTWQLQNPVGFLLDEGQNALTASLYVTQLSDPHLTSSKNFWYDPYCGEYNGNTGDEWVQNIEVNGEYTDFVMCDADGDYEWADGDYVEVAEANNVTFTLKDTACGLDSGTFVFKENGVTKSPLPLGFDKLTNFQSGLAERTYSYPVANSLAKGEHLFEITAKDLGGNSCTVCRWLVNVTNSCDAWTENLIGGCLINNGPNLLEGGATFPTSAGDRQVEINATGLGTIATVVCPSSNCRLSGTSGSSSTYEWNYSWIPSGEGYYNISVATKGSCTDLSPLTSEVVVDWTPPTLTCFDPPNIWSRFNVSAVDSGSAFYYDPTPRNMSIDNSLTVDQYDENSVPPVEWVNTTPLNERDYFASGNITFWPFEYGLPWNYTPYDVNVSIADRCGNFQQKNCGFTVPQPPVGCTLSSDVEVLLSDPAATYENISNVVIDYYCAEACIKNDLSFVNLTCSDTRSNMPVVAYCTESTATTGSCDLTGVECDYRGHDAGSYWQTATIARKGLEAEMSECLQEVKVTNEPPFSCAITNTTPCSSTSTTNFVTTFDYPTEEIPSILFECGDGLTSTQTVSCTCTSSPYGRPQTCTCPVSGDIPCDFTSAGVNVYYLDAIAQTSSPISCSQQFSCEAPGAGDCWLEAEPPRFALGESGQKEVNVSMVFPDSANLNNGLPNRVYTDGFAMFDCGNGTSIQNNTPCTAAEVGGVGYCNSTCVYNAIGTFNISTTAEVPIGTACTNTTVISSQCGMIPGAVTVVTGEPAAFDYIYYSGLTKPAPGEITIDCGNGQFLRSCCFKLNPLYNETLCEEGTPEACGEFDLTSSNGGRTGRCTPPRLSSCTDQNPQLSACSYLVPGATAYVSVANSSVTNRAYINSAEHGCDVNSMLVTVTPKIWKVFGTLKSEEESPLKATFRAVNREPAIKAKNGCSSTPPACQDPDQSCCTNTTDSSGAWGLRLEEGFYDIFVDIYNTAEPDEPILGTISFYDVQIFKDIRDPILVDDPVYNFTLPSVYNFTSECDNLVLGADLCLPFSTIYFPPGTSITYQERQDFIKKHKLNDSAFSNRTVQALLEYTLLHGKDPYLLEEYEIESEPYLLAVSNDFSDFFGPTAKVPNNYIYGSYILSMNGSGSIFKCNLYESNSCQPPMTPDDVSWTELETKAVPPAVQAENQKLFSVREGSKALFAVGEAVTCGHGGSQDFICPSVICVGKDADCCGMATNDEEVQCSPGKFCDKRNDGGLWGVCESRRGNFCTTDADCEGDSYCSLDSHKCVSRCFATAVPTFATAGVGEKKIVELRLQDPILERGSYHLKIDGTGRFFSKFANGQQEMDVSLEKGEVKSIPITVSPPGIGQYDITVNARHLTYSSPPSAGIGSDNCADKATFSVLVQTAMSSGPTTVYSAPSLDWASIAILALLASLIFATKRF